MIYRKYLIAGTCAAFAMLSSAPASASYMSDCNALISKWKTCGETSEDCTVEFTTIEKECKCHAFKQGEWKLVMAAVGKDGVCAPAWPGEPVPDPSPPKHDPDKGDPGKKGHDDDGGGDDKSDDGSGRPGGKATPVTTHGGERDPNN